MEERLDKARSNSPDPPAVHRYPSSIATLRKVHRALHELSELLQQELTKAIQGAHSRQLGTARHVDAVVHYLAQRSRAGGTATGDIPPALSIGPDLSIGLKYIDAAALTAHAASWADAVTALAEFEGRPFDRKMPTIGKRTKEAPPTTANQEREALQHLECVADQLLTIFCNATAEFEHRLLTGRKRRASTPEANSRTLTPPQAAKRLGVSPDKVRAWIAGGELVASNMAAAGSQRPRWRIAEKDLGEFEKRRQPGKPVVAKRKQRKADGGVKEYF